MTTTLLKKSKGSPGREAATRALREAGFGVVEVDDWNDAADELRKCEAALVVCSGEWLDSVDTTRLTRAISALTGLDPPDNSGMALDAARELRPDLVLMDVNLPGISGLDATRVILAEGDEPRPLVIVFSTYEPAEYAPRAAEAGAVGYITKSELSPERLEEVWAAAQNGRAASA